MIAELLLAYERDPTLPFSGASVEAGLDIEIKLATDLQKHWQSRFKSDFTNIEKYRFDELMSSSLHDVAWSATASDGLGVWLPRHAVDISEAEGHTRFSPGQ